MNLIQAYAVGIVILGFMPFTAYAQTSQQQLEQQIAVLLSQINALQALIGSSSSAQSSYQTLPTYGSNLTILSSIPLVLSGDLNTGDNKYEVTLLQQHLARDPNIYPEALVTGFYGPATTAAVRRFQIACNIVVVGNEVSTGFGRVGPQTRQALRFGCQSAVTERPSVPTPTTYSPFNAANVPYIQTPAYQSPQPTTSTGPVYTTSGPLPLMVTAQASFNTLSCSTPLSSYRTYRLNYGDGEYQDMHYKIRDITDPECG